MPGIEVSAATPADAAAIAEVIGSCGDARHCWCAFWSRPDAEFRREGGEGNRRWFMARLATATEPLGVVARIDGEAAGWCALMPRRESPRLAKARVLAAVDDVPVWSVTCFVVARRFRRQGVMRALLDGAIRLAREAGASCIEAYPVDPQRKMGAGELYTGVLPVFLDAGFVEVARRGPSRPIVRLAPT